MKPFLILQLRPEDAASDDEFAAFLRFGGLTERDVVRVRMEQQAIPDDLDLSHYSGVLVGGGPSCVSDPEDKKPQYQTRFETELRLLLDHIIELDFPFLGMCYGFSILAYHLGSIVNKEKYAEDAGAMTVQLTTDGTKDKLTSGLQPTFRVFGGHKESSQNQPPHSTVLVTSPQCPYQMIRYKRNIYATQFHTELDADGLELRIRTYRDLGYFKPEDAEQLIVAGHQETVTEPMKILQRFVNHYQQPTGQL
jgi:GMP synthase (glutamine-hydrolysing)